MAEQLLGPFEKFVDCG